MSLHRTLHALLLALLLPLAGCEWDTVDSEGYWRPYGLDDVRVNELDLQEGFLYAATDEGFYRRTVDEADAAWEPFGLQEEEVVDLAWLPGGGLLAAVRVEDAQSPSPALYRLRAGREQWEPYQNDFGGTEGYSHIEALASHPAGRDTVFARGQRNVAKSTDAGANWRSVYEDWDASGYQAPLIYFHPNDPARIWAGGENSIFQPYLLRSTDYGETWTLIDLEAGGDNAAYAMAIHPETEEILVGMEARILHSADGGDTWETVFEPDSEAYILDMELHDGVVYASGSEEGTAGGPLTLYRSTDFGQTWTRIRYTAGPAQTFANTLTVAEEGDQTMLYLGTGQGVFRYAE